MPLSPSFTVLQVDDDLEDEHDYDRVVLPGAGASDEEQDDEDIYKIPRNVVSLSLVCPPTPHVTILTTFGSFQ